MRRVLHEGHTPGLAGKRDQKVMAAIGAARPAGMTVPLKFELIALAPVQV
jgi:hypothetical protein